MKSKISFVCQECGYDTPKFFGKCPECGEWNSLREVKISKFSTSPPRFAKASSGERLRGAGKIQSDVRSVTLGEIKYEEQGRIKTGFSELDGVLGGGIVGGSMTLLAGDPGIGKSTLLLQMALNVSNSFWKTQKTQKIRDSDNSEIQTTRFSDSPMNRSSKLSESSENPVLYISAEESAQQIKLRAERIGGTKDSKLQILSETNSDALVSFIEEMKPSLVIIDSIQTVESENLEGLSGSVGQVRYAAGAFTKLAKTLNIPIIIVGHVTKEGMVAGPMVLSHMVDTVLFLEGERFVKTRILKSLKNRFGPVDEVGVFEMDNEGMKDVKNPEHIFLSDLNKNSSGSALVVTQEGSRSFLVEIQALVVFSKLPLPRRVAAGIDTKRLELLLAVLQKHCNLPLATMDVFVNVAGGLKISDPACDLGICLAIFSSFKSVPLLDTIGIAEVGLLGELRDTNSLEKRVREAKKMGFNKIISAKTHRTINEVIKSLGR